MNVSLCLGSKCRAYTMAPEDLLVMCLFTQPLSVLFLLKALTNSKWKEEHEQSTPNSMSIFTVLWRFVCKLHQKAVCNKYDSAIMLQLHRTSNSNSLVFSDGTWMQYTMIEQMLPFSSTKMCTIHEFHSPSLSLFPPGFCCQTTA